MDDQTRKKFEAAVSAPRPDKPKRIIVSPKPRHLEISAEAMVIPALDGLLNDSLTIIGNELARYRAKSARGASLELKEARAVQGYMKTLVELSRESREQSRHEDLSSMSNQELLELAQKELNGESEDSDDETKDETEDE